MGRLYGIDPKIKPYYSANDHSPNNEIRVSSIDPGAQMASDSRVTEEKLAIIAPPPIDKDEKPL